MATRCEASTPNEDVRDSGGVFHAQAEGWWPLFSTAFAFNEGRVRGGAAIPRRPPQAALPASREAGGRSHLPRSRALVTGPRDSAGPPESRPVAVCAGRPESQRMIQSTPNGPGWGMRLAFANLRKHLSNWSQAGGRKPSSVANSHSPDVSRRTCVHELGPAGPSLAPHCPEFGKQQRTPEAASEQANPDSLVRRRLTVPPGATGSSRRRNSADVLFEPCYPSYSEVPNTPVRDPSCPPRRWLLHLCPSDKPVLFKPVHLPARGPR